LHPPLARMLPAALILLVAIIAAAAFRPR